MGWTSYHATYYKNGKVDRKAECDSYFMEGLNKGHFEVVKSSMVGNTYYGAVKSLLKSNGKNDDGEYVYKPIPDNEQKIFAVVFLTSTDMKDYFNFSYKDMDESMYPCYYDCPIGILNILSETENEYALEWRKSCREKHIKKNADRKDAHSLKNLPVGTKIVFTAKYETKANNAGDEITLTKITNFNRKSFWYGHGYKWSEQVIKNISGGEYKVVEP